MNGDAPPQNVVDEDGSVDKAVKKRIIQARERVDEAEVGLYLNVPTNPDVRLGEAEKVHIYGTMVKQFLRRIEPLLQTPKIDNNEAYYENELIDEIRLVPPDTRQFQFTAVADTETSDQELRRRIGLPRGADIPQPKVVPFYGLRDVIEKDTILSHTWEVCVSNEGAPPNHEYVYPTVQQPAPKQLYEEAMRLADRFLQEVKLGLDLEMPAYTGDDGPGI